MSVNMHNVWEMGIKTHYHPLISTNHNHHYPGIDYSFIKVFSLSNANLQYPQGFLPIAYATFGSSL